MYIKRMRDDLALRAEVSRSKGKHRRKGTEDHSGTTKGMGSGYRAKGQGKPFLGHPRKPADTLIKKRRCSICNEKKQWIRRGTNPPVCIDCRPNTQPIRRVDRIKSQKKDIYEIQIHENGIFIGNYFIPWKRYIEMRKKVKEWRENQ